MNAYAGDEKPWKRRLHEKLGLFPFLPVPPITGLHSRPVDSVKFFQVGPILEVGGTCVGRGKRPSSVGPFRPGDRAIQVCFQVYVREVRARLALISAIPIDVPTFGRFIISVSQESPPSPTIKIRRST